MTEFFRVAADAPLASTPGIPPSASGLLRSFGAGQLLPKASEGVLILDGNTRSALAATRSLGRRGVPVVVADEGKRTLAGASKFCGRSFSYPGPAANLRGFLSTIKNECLKRGIRVIFPMSEVSLAAVLKHREELEDFALPFVDFDAFEAMTDKWNLMKVAQRLNITIPQTHYIGDARSLERVYPSLKFPVVMKPYRSRVWANGRCTVASVKYAESVRELEEMVARYEYFRSSPFLLQEYVRGHGHGIFALYDRGKAVASFAHRRLRENPPSGGVSVLCESVEKHPEAWRAARTLLEHVGWHGVAMVEFKVTEEGKPYLMEVNGRFWGSLQLAIDAGVDFPWLLYQMATGREVDAVEGYATGVRSRWLMGDVARLCKVLLGTELPPDGRLPERMRAIWEFLNFFDAKTRCEEGRWRDFKPFFFELEQFLRR